MKNNCNSFILLHQYVLNEPETSYSPTYVRVNDISCISIQLIGGKKYTKIMLNCGQFIYTTETIEEIMNNMEETK